MPTFFPREYLYWLETNAPLTYSGLIFLKELGTFLHDRVYSLGLRYVGETVFERLSQDTITLVRRIVEQIIEIYNNYIVLYQQDDMYQSGLYSYVNGIETIHEGFPLILTQT